MTRRLTRALVGWTGSNADRRRQEQIESWLTEHRPTDAASWKKMSDTKFNLSYRGPRTDDFGSDFLADTATFDIVVLHFLFGDTECLDLQFTDPIVKQLFAQSQFQSPTRWRKRLRDSEATRVFACGSLTEVAGNYLLGIRGYRKIHTPFGAVYERERIPA